MQWLEFKQLYLNRFNQENNLYLENKYFALNQKNMIDTYNLITPSRDSCSTDR